MEGWKEIIICICIILVSIVSIRMSEQLDEQEQEITNLENKVNYVIWERDYIDHALEDSLKQY